MESTLSGANTASGPVPPWPKAVSPAPPHSIAVAGHALAVSCRNGDSVLDAFEKARTRPTQNGRDVVRVGCRRGGCGICKIRVLAGEVSTSAMSRAHVSQEDQDAGYVLACCAYPETDLTVQSVPLLPITKKQPVQV